jgi:hypothetical protein
MIGRWIRCQLHVPAAVGDLDHSTTTMRVLTKAEKREFLRKHLRHRLTLLRTLRQRKRSGESYQGRGDIYRCVKDANLMAVRLFLDFMGLRGVRDSTGLRLEPNPRKKGAKYQDDVKIDQFIGQLLVPGDIPKRFHQTLAGVYCRGDKELAHLTMVYSGRFNTESALIRAAGAVETVLSKRLFCPLNEPFPEMDK